MTLILLFCSTLLMVASCHRYTKEMLYLDTYYGYEAYTDPVAYVRQLDTIVQNVISLTKRMNIELDRDLDEASNYDLRSSVDSVNLNATEIINKMLARQFVVDLLIYKLLYCEQMYNAAVTKFKKGTDFSPLFEDLSFETPIQKMIIYEWVDQIVKTFNEAAKIGDKLSDNWKKVRESINSNTIGIDISK